MLPCPCSAQTPPNALMLQPLATRTSLPPVLALLWMLTKGRPSSTPSSCANTQGHPASHHRYPFPAVIRDPQNIPMIPQLGQRLHLPRDGPSVSLEQKRIGRSLGSDSKVSRTITSTQPVWSGPDFATPPASSSSVAPGRGGRSLLSEEQD